MPNREWQRTGRWGSVVGQLRRRYLETLLLGFENEAERVIREAIEAGVPEGVIDAEVIAPGMRVIGDLWEAGAITVADEHLGHADLHPRDRAPARGVPRRADTRVLLLGLEGEQHTLGLQMARSILSNAGYGVVMLGADVPSGDLPGAIDRHRPAVVGVSATVSGLAGELTAVIELVRAHAPAIGVIAGGPAVRSSLGSMAGVAVCRHVGDVVELTDGLLHHSSFN